MIDYVTKPKLGSCLEMTKFGFRILFVLHVFFIVFLFSMISVSAQSVGTVANSKNSAEIILSVIFAFTAVVGIALFMLFGTEKRISLTEEYCPPEGMSPAEASYILNGQSKAFADIPSLIIYWANEGYLSINNVSKAGTDELECIKLKDSDAAMKTDEKLIFEKLFHGQQSVSFTNLKEHFSIKQGGVNAAFTRMFRRSATSLITRESTIAAAVCALLAVLCVGILPACATVIQKSDLVAGIFGEIFALLITGCFCIILRYFRTAKKKWLGGCIAVYCVFLLVIAWIFHFTPAAVMACAAAAECGLLAAFMKRHTKQGSELLAKLLGLKEFMTTAEKGRLTTIVQEKPSLFFTLLPFAYALGVADKWAIQFENIVVAKPVWYNSNTYGIFSTIYFTSIFNRIIAGNQIGRNAFAISAFASNNGFQTGSCPRGGPR